MSYSIVSHLMCSPCISDRVRYESDKHNLLCACGETIDGHNIKTFEVHHSLNKCYSQNGYGNLIKLEIIFYELQ